MTTELIDLWLVQLGRASLAGLLAAAAGWLLARGAFAPAVKTWIWWAVSLKFLLVLALPPLALPWLPAATSPSAATSGEIHGAAAAIDWIAPIERQAPAKPLWRPVLAATWLLGALAGCLAAGRRWLEIRRLVQRSRPVAETGLEELFDRLCREHGVAGAGLRRSDWVDSPLVVGLWRPTVLLPEERAALSDAEWRLLLEHEITHLRRRDLWLSLVPALAEKLFFFHPAARLAAREYDLHREAACDAAVLSRHGAAPRTYGRLLLKLCHPSPQRLAAAAAARRQTLERRLRMLARPVSKLSPARALVLGLAALTLLVPVRLTARSASEPEPELAAADAARVAAEQETGQDASGYSYIHHDDGSAYVLLSGGESWLHGRSDDIDRARTARHDDEDLFWTRYQNATWVIRDRAFLDRVNELFRPQRELGRQQGELGALQGTLGEQQGDLGARQAALGKEQAALAGRQVEVTASHLELSAKLMRLEHAKTETAERAELRARLAELDAAQREIGELQGKLGREMGELGRLQGELGGRQGELGGRQGELGRRQAEVSREISRQLGELVAEAIAAGKAERVD